MKKELIRIMVRSVYDLQQIRIQMGNRIVINFRQKLGQSPGEPTEEMDLDAQKLLRELKATHAKLTDGILGLQDISRDIAYPQEGTITSEVELLLIGQYKTIESAEKQQFKDLCHLLEQFSIYPWLSSVRGIGPAMAGVIISELDPFKAKYPSSFIMYCGLDVAEDGQARSRKAEHLVSKKYLNKDGEEKEKMGITYNPWIRSKLIGVLGPSFIKLKNEKYSKIYKDYKNRLENHPKHIEKTKKHRHNMAIRYMIKMFLIDLHCEWRRLEGLPVSTSYAEGKLGLKHAVGE